MMTIAGALAPTTGAIQPDGASLVGKSPENLRQARCLIRAEGRHVLSAHRRRECPHRIGHATGPPEHRWGLRAGDGLFSVPARTPVDTRRQAVGRQAAAAGDRAGADDAAQDHADRRTVARPCNRSSSIASTKYPCAAQRRQHTARGGAEHASRTRECGSST